MKTLIFISSFILSLSASGQKNATNSLKDKVFTDSIKLPFGLELKENKIIKYAIGDTVIYNYKNGFVSKSQEDKYMNDVCIATAIIIDKKPNKYRNKVIPFTDSGFFIKVRLLNACDKKGIISSDSKNSLVLNKKTNKWERPKKRVVKYMNPGEERWFNYVEWETIE